MPVGRAPTAGHFFSRDRGHYTATKRYRPREVSYVRVVRAIDGLLDAGVIEEQRTRPSAYATERSRMRLTQAARQGIGMGTVLDLQYVPIELVRKKNQDKQLVDYRDTAATRNKRRELEAQNEAVSSISICLKSPDWQQDDRGLLRKPRHALNPNRISLYRVFNNNSWKLGGRLYGGFWQRLPKRDRALLQIDETRVAECDFPHLHPTFLSDLAGIDFKGEDPYSIDGHERALVKSAFNILLNAYNELTATHAITRRVIKLGYVTEDDGVETAYNVARCVIEAIKKRHPQFGDFWATGLGLRLQGSDSDLCSNVLKKLRSNGVVALPVHDSFIVPERAKDNLEEIMHDELDRARRDLRSNTLKYL